MAKITADLLFEPPVTVDGKRLLQLCLELRNSCIANIKLQKKFLKGIMTYFTCSYTIQSNNLKGVVVNICTFLNHYMRPD